MSITPPSKTELLGWMDEVDNSLKKVTGYLDTVFTDIEHCPQEVVDYLCSTAGDYASYVLECGKVKILNGLGAQKAATQDILDKYGPLAAAMSVVMSPPSIDTIVKWATSVIEVIKQMYDIVIKPYEEAVEFITEMTTKIISISNSMQQIASYTPPQAPDISFDKFHIEFQPFTISDIGENIPYPDPPEIKPFPNPFADSIKMAKDKNKDKSQNA